MIKLVISQDTQPEAIYQFDSEVLVIGGKTSTTADIILEAAVRGDKVIQDFELVLPSTVVSRIILHSPSIQESHIQISKLFVNHQIQYFISNLTHDPFLTLNGMPFGRRPLHNLDVIQIDEVLIRCEINLKYNDRETTSDAIGDEVGVVTGTEDQSESDKASATISSQTPRPSLKDYYLSEYDDVEPNQRTTTPDNSLGNPFLHFETIKSWSLVIKMLSFGVLMSLLALTFVYFWISGQSEEEEIKASKGVADVAIALAYAQIKNIQPQNQNWSEPEFIRKNLLSVLAPEFSSNADIDGHGHFINCSYILRIYTSSDLSQFLVIAQPTPSLLHWIIPKATIMLDSHSMELRKIHDVKGLNRLLVNPTLDKTNSQEVSNLIKQGELITLARLNQNNETSDFMMPKALALMHPGTENFIYNALRYYWFSQSFLNKSIELFDKPISRHDVLLFQNEMAAMSKFPNLILYSPDGLQGATQCHKALSALAPDDKFLIGYLQKNGAGKVCGAHLLLTDLIETPNKDPLFPQLNDLAYTEKNSYNSDEQPPSSNLLSHFSSSAEIFDIDPNDSLYLRLVALSHSRQQALKPIGDEINLLINREIQTLQPQFTTQLSVLYNHFLNTDKNQTELLQNALAAVCQENSYIPAARFLDFIKAAELEPFLKSYLAELKTKVGMRLDKNELALELEQIETSKNLEDLERNASQIASQLVFEIIPDEEILISHQNALRFRVIQKLNQFLLSSDYNPETFVPESKKTLTNILETIWIIDPETYDFYLSELELHTNSLGNSTENIKKARS